ncbi:hypothetical protein L596_019924 [Steinernema carpocapsae]|uniref:Piwi domain-containing protein n=1 Tax=Steinernema carpocapsae TaxID=34508 RepID=A0A4U5MS78_STECR|nr:hypothetical protein L596_019924 [Steinernema carpocapsae]
MEPSSQPPPTPSLPENMAPKIVGPRDIYERPVPIASNLFPLEMKADVPIFMYHVQIHMKIGAHEINLVKRHTDDYMHIDHKDKCRAAFRFAVRSSPATFGDPKGLFYDLQGQLYSDHKLKDVLGHDLIVREEIGIPGEEAGRAPEFKNLGVEYLRVEVEPTRENRPTMILGEMMATRAKMQESVSRELTQFLEVATSQYAFLTPSKMVTYPSGVSYFKPTTAEPVQVFPAAKELLDGVHKVVKLIDGTKRGEMAVVVDPKKAVFHKSNITVIDKTVEMGFLDRGSGTVLRETIPELAKKLKNLYVETRYGKKPIRFAVHDVVLDTARTSRFNKNGDMTSVEEHFKDEYNVILKHPHAPLVVSTPLKKNPESLQLLYFPMELLFVCPNQRVLFNQQTAKEAFAIKKASTILPENRLKEVVNSASKLRINGASVQGCFKKAKIEVGNAPLTVEGRSLVPPHIEYRAQQVQVDAVSGRWRSSSRRGKPQYLVGGKIERWAMYVLSQAPSQAEEELGKNLLAKMEDEFQARGMQIAQAKFLATVKASPEYMKKIFDRAKAHQLEFLFFIQDTKICLHKEMKYYERKYEIISQDLNMETAKAVTEEGKYHALDSLIAKLNVKVGGTNYGLVGPSIPDLFKRGKLYIGFHASFSANPADAEDPTVIGSSANVTQTSAAFVGDMFFQEKNDVDMNTAMAKATLKYVLRYKNVHGHAPSEVVIYRSGSSEGQFGQILRDEVPALRNALQNAEADEAKLTLLMVNKQHSVRLMPSVIMPGSRAIEQNIKPGTVVDTKITHPRFAEFYLNSHQVLHGTAKTPKYTIIVDDSAHQIEYLERVTYALSYGHQIVDNPTNLPSPLYIAGEYADRGLTLIKAKRKLGDTVDVKDLEKDLPYMASQVLADKRVNA